MLNCDATFRLRAAMKASTFPERFSGGQLRSAPAPFAERPSCDGKGLKAVMQEIDISTVVFALLAAFVVWKLRSVLGERADHDQQSRDKAIPPRGPADAANGNAPIAVPSTATSGGKNSEAEDLDPALSKGLEQIAIADPGFSKALFLNGAKGAYEMVISAFAAGDRQTLRDLLSKDVLESFTAAIADREQRGQTVLTTFVSIDNAEIKDVQVRGRTAQVTVQFQSKLISATKDRDGSVIDGSPDKIVDVVDVWTFSRELGSRDPNWRLVATEASA
jgi:predicted lipid-binding transport protein (Tim44 family)